MGKLGSDPMTWLTSARMGAWALTSGIDGIEFWATLTVPMVAIAGDMGTAVIGTVAATMLPRGMVLAVIPGEA